MDAHALLTSQGWRGTGNSLHPTSNAIGLSKPLLVGRKDDKNGLGKKKHQTSDMWWMQAFDQSLKALQTSEHGPVKKSTSSRGGLDAVRRGASKWVLANGGLYANFIKGDGLAGSLNSSDPSKDQLIEEAIKPKKKKITKSALKDTVSDISKSKRSKKGSETREERRARKLAKRLLRKNTTSTRTTESSSSVKLAKKKKKKSNESIETQAER